MWKYRNQTLVSVAGLAVGFVCFAMATLWIRYEMTYDSFHKNADRIYCVNMPDVFSSSGIRRSNIPCPLAGRLKSTFPEIAKAVAIMPRSLDIECEGIVVHKADFLMIDSSFFSMFDVKVLEGNMDFLIPENNKMAITRERALQMFGNESPVGKKISWGFAGCDIGAVISDLPKRSNYPFDFLGGVQTNIENGYYLMGDMLIELVPGINMEAFEKKLKEQDFQIDDVNHIDNHINNLTLTPLTSVRYKDPTVERNVQFQHIIIFALAGSLLILCTLFNYLTLFVSRFRMRQRELALRTVYGASGRSLFAMLSVEFIMSLTAALVLGLALINILRFSFLKVSGAHLDLSAIYLESVIYIAGIIVAALTVFFLTLAIFRRRTLNASIRSNKKIFRKTSIAVQLIISIVFAFCTLVILKQMYYLHSTDLGFALKNRGSIAVLVRFAQIEILNDKIKQIPEIKETITGYFPLLPIYSRSSEKILDWEGKQRDAEMDIESSRISEQYAKFYEFELIEGDFLRDDDDRKHVLINESAAKAFGWNKAVGKTFNNYVVKGVMKNIYNFSPTIAAKPFFFHSPDIADTKRPMILFKYDEGSWKTCMEKIKKIVEKEFPDRLYEYRFFEYYSMEEEYDKYLKSENALLAILTAVSLVCLMVCIFGFVSMVSLTCEDRRKEIAIRKINGATVKDILDIFFREYLSLLAVGALIAFPTGYIIMKRWLEQYVIQTEMSAWIYLSILLALMLVIIMCVGGRVYRTSRENPVNAIN
jgi:ABC-type antimicrobial peptide transport system permease subunit